MVGQNAKSVDGQAIEKQSAMEWDVRTKSVVGQSLERAA